MLWLLLACAPVVIEADGTDTGWGAGEDAPVAERLDAVPIVGEPATCLGDVLAVDGPVGCGARSLFLGTFATVDGWGSCLPDGFAGVVFDVTDDAVIGWNDCGHTVEAYAIGHLGSCLAVDGGARLLPGARLAIGGTPGALDLWADCL